jgi:hypothetical protein
MKTSWRSWLGGRVPAFVRSVFKQQRPTAHRREVIVANEYAGAPLASFYAFASRPAVVDIPLSRCRGLWFAAFPCTPEAGHPFVETMKAFSGDPTLTYERSPLRAYYEKWQPSSAAQALGLEPRTEPGPLDLAPSIAAVAPWWPVEDLKTFADELHALVDAENAEFGPPLGAENGVLLHGPTSPAKGALEFRRCTEIIERVRDEGYRRRSETPDGDIRGQLLVDESGDYTVLVLSGQHRIAAAAAAGHDAVPIRFFDGKKSGARVVRRTEAEAWPLVRCGWFTREEAASVFDRLFAGRPPWSNRVTELV